MNSVHIDFTDTGCGVYQILCVPTSRVYIGSTSCFSRRWEQHREELIRGIHTNYKLQRAWDKYGARAFVFEVVEYTQPTLRLMREQFYIDTLHAVDKGFNIQRRTQPTQYTAARGRRAIMETRRQKRFLMRQILGTLIVWVVGMYNARVGGTRRG